MKCNNITDQFSVSNSKAKLTYPIGLFTTAETELLGNNNLRKTAIIYNSRHYCLNAAGIILASRCKKQHKAAIMSPKLHIDSVLDIEYLADL